MSLKDTERPDPDRIALGVRQPWAELIMQGHKTVEVRSQNTNVRGRIYIYASKKLSDMADAKTVTENFNIDCKLLPRGVVVGSVEIHDSVPTSAVDATAACVAPKLLKDRYSWRLQDPIAFEEPLPVKFLPYGVWFYPWKRRTK